MPARGMHNPKWPIQLAEMAYLASSDVDIDEQTLSATSQQMNRSASNLLPCLYINLEHHPYQI